jgi:hypothetical protein
MPTRWWWSSNNEWKRNESEMKESTKFFFKLPSMFSMVWQKLKVYRLRPFITLINCKSISLSPFSLSFFIRFGRNEKFSKCDYENYSIIYGLSFLSKLHPKLLPRLHALNQFSLPLPAAFHRQRAFVHVVFQMHFKVFIQRLTFLFDFFSASSGCLYKDLPW